MRVVHPDLVYINRGNHEAAAMNIKELCTILNHYKNILNQNNSSCAVPVYTVHRPVNLISNLVGTIYIKY